jgi:hypothetical protein
MSAMATTKPWMRRSRDVTTASTAYRRSGPAEDLLDENLAPQKDEKIMPKMLTTGSIALRSA